MAKPQISLDRDRLDIGDGYMSVGEVSKPPDSGFVVCTPDWEGSVPVRGAPRRLATYVFGYPTTYPSSGRGIVVSVLELVCTGAQVVFAWYAGHASTDTASENWNLRPVRAVQFS